MSKLYFVNDGVFDVSAMMTFGVSVKESDDAIGYFGTGFKYAVAIILRLGGTITVTTGGDKYEFSSVTRQIRGQDFDLVQMNGVDAGFTTRLGISWKPWQAYRELYCNCIDEGGSILNRRRKADTTVSVECEEISAAHNNKANYFIAGKHIYADSAVEIYDGWKPNFYYKGVAVADSDESIFSYNMKNNVDLTEDRTAKYVDYDIRSRVASSIQQCTDKSLLRRALTSTAKGDKERLFRHELPVSNEFLSACRALLSEDKGIPASALKVLAAADHKEGKFPEAKISKVQKIMLDKAVAFLSSIDIENQYEIKVVKGLGDGVMGMARDGVIYLSLIPFEHGTKQLASTILEEYVHLKYECHDFDRRMQSWLFDKVLTIGEEMSGTPL